MNSPPQAAVDTAYYSQPPESVYRMPTPSYPTSNSMLGSYITPDYNPSLPETIQNITTTAQPVTGSPAMRHYSAMPDVTSGPGVQHRIPNHDSPVLGRQPANGHPPGMAGSPVPGRHPMVSQGTQSSPMLSRQYPINQGTPGSPILSRQPTGQQAVQSSPVPSRQPALNQQVIIPSQSSPVLSRQPSVTQANQGSPVLTRQASLPHQASPVLGHHSTITQGSPILDRHPIQYSGYNTPDERHGALSRQSSSSGYQPPSTPSFPVSPAGYMEGAGFRQGSPGLQPQLPEKRRMSSGERPNGGLSYGTLNGKMSSPVSSGGSTPSVHFFHTLPDFSKLNMCGKT